MNQGERRLRGVPHLGEQMRERGITADMVHSAIEEPDAVQPADRGRVEYRKLYHDPMLDRHMLLRVIVEPGAVPIVITAMKTSRIARCLPGEAQP
jgi:hypothetical protein